MPKADREMTADERHVYKRLQWWESRFDGIVTLYDRNSRSPFMPAIHVDRARALYVKLKADLKDERRRLDGDDVTPAEKRWLDRPIRQAKAHLQAPTNWRPEKWRSDLHNSREDIALQIHKLRDYFGLRRGELTGWPEPD